MSISVIVFISLYICTLITYFFTETSNNFKLRVINKIILASLFFIFGIIMFIFNYNILSYHIILLLAILFAYIGDILLLFSFTKGGLSFITSNIFFFIYQWIVIYTNNVPFINISWFLILLALIYLPFLVISLKGKINLGINKKAILLYVLTVSLQGSLGICLAVYFKTINMILLGSGLGLFMISDYFLMTYNFKIKKNWILRCNSGTYFIGLLLVVLSLMF